MTLAPLIPRRSLGLFHSLFHFYKLPSLQLCEYFPNQEDKCWDLNLRCLLTGPHFRVTGQGEEC